jgi:hypothetical protein
MDPINLIATNKFETFDSEQLRTMFRENKVIMQLQDLSYQRLVLASGTNIQPIIFPATPIQGIWIFTDQPLYIKINDSVNCPNITITTYFTLDTNNFNSAFLSNPGLIAANIDIYLSVQLVGSTYPTYPDSTYPPWNY